MSSRPPLSTARKISYAGSSLFVIGSVVRIALERHWHSVSPRVSDAASGHTYPLSGRGGTVYLTSNEDVLLSVLTILSGIFLVIGMLAWARTWREWK